MKITKESNNKKYVGADASVCPVLRKTQNKGITLIALVITIIVMLILVSVTITIAINGGLFEKAEEAREKFDITKEKEQLQLAMVCMQAEFETDLIKRKEIFIDSLENEKVNVYINGMGYTVHYLDTNRIYTIDDIGNILEEDSSILVKDNTLGEFDGSGTKEDPYIIMSIEDLVEWTCNYNNYASANIKLGRSLDFKSELSYCDYTSNTYNDEFSITDENVTLLEALTSTSYSGFKPIESFSGIFDGDNYSVKNVYINKNESVGGLLKKFYGTKIENLKISGNINGNGAVGGIISDIYNSCTIKNCTFSGDIQNSSQEVVYQGTGGIVGKTSKQSGIFVINNCVSKGKITGINNLGGIVGYNVSGICKIDQCINESYIKGGATVGGIMGQANGSIIKNSINTGFVQGTSTIGGIAGYNPGLIINSYNNGSVNGINTVGGIVGSCYFINSSIYNSYNIGKIDVINQHNGAIIGSIYPYSTNVTIDNVFWIKNSTNKSIGSGENNTTGQAISITETQISSTTENGLLEKLNDYVKTYNSQNKENKADTDGEDLINWIMNVENKYPTLDL